MDTAPFPESRVEEQDNLDDASSKATLSSIIRKIVTEKVIKWAITGTIKVPGQECFLQSVDDVMPS